MKKVAVVYWSGTGNTEAMANAVAEGAKEAGAQVTVFNTEGFSPEAMDDFDAVAFGCPSMGAEVLEETEFEPLFESCKGRLTGKNIALFGSYDWGDGEWMRNWTKVCEDAGANLVCESLICHLDPKENDVKNCREMGAALA